MTADKGFKHLIRQRARRTGEPYVIARRRLRAKHEEMAVSELNMRRAVEESWGFAISYPDSWERLPPNRPTELLRVAAPPAGRPFVIVQKMLAGDTDLETYATRYFGSWRETPDFSQIVPPVHTTLGGAPAMVGHCVQQSEMTRGDALSMRSFVVVRSPAVFNLRMSSLDAERDKALLDAIVESFEFV